MSYLDKAVSLLHKLGISVETSANPVIPLLEKVIKYDPNKVTVIAATLQQSSAFNTAVRDHIQNIEISTKYAEITDKFNSIRNDAQQMVDWMADGKLDFRERIMLAWKNSVHGSIPVRFNSIRETFLAVSHDANKQIEIESSILSAYFDFRLALKEADVYAQDVLKIAEQSLVGCKNKLQEAGRQIEVHQGDSAELSRLELARDEILRDVQEEDKTWQIMKDIADDLKTAYNTAELIFARLQQSHSVKERLYQRSVSFFSTNEVVFSGLSASFTSLSGLSEATKTMEAMKQGVNDSLETLAKAGNQQLEAAMRSGYGATIKTESVKSLVDAIVDFQASSNMLIKQLREETTKTVLEIESATEDGKRRFAKLLAK